MKLSASKIKTFRTCARKYYFSYVEGKEDDKNLAALFGTALHKAIEMKYKGDENPKLVFQSTMITTLEEWANKKVAFEENFAAYITEGKSILDNMDWEKFRPIELEYNFSVQLGDHEVVGYIDMITADGKVIDHKSAKKKPNVLELSHDPQFILYAYAYKQMYNKLPRLFWHHLRTQELLEVTINNFDEKIRQLEIDIAAMAKAENFARVLFGQTCFFCSYKQECWK